MTVIVPTSSITALWLFWTAPALTLTIINLAKSLTILVANHVCDLIAFDYCLNPMIFTKLIAALKAVLQRDDFL